MKARRGPPACRAWSVAGEATTKAKRKAVLSQWMAAEEVEKNVAAVLATGA
jgi:hypothetical protein